MLSQIPQPHFPFVTRVLLDLWQRGELPSVATLGVDPAFGHVGRICYQNGAVRMFRASSLGLNPQGAADVARDKADTRLFLQELGYAVPQGRVFAMPAHRQRLEQSAERVSAERRTALAQLGSAEEVADWIAQGPGYPCYLKPNNSAQGRGVVCCRSRAEVEATLAGYERMGVGLLLAEAAVAWPEYRVVVLRDQVVAAYERRAPLLVGDGRSTLAALLAAFGELSENVLARLGAQSLDRVLESGEQLRLHDVANLSAGGSAVDIRLLLDADWRRRCVELVAAMGLVFCGIDLACADIGNADAPYAIIELNSAPGLEHYAALGAAQLEQVRALYRDIFDQPPL